jgi:hypothetical protein
MVLEVHSAASCAIRVLMACQLGGSFSLRLSNLLNARVAIATWYVAAKPRSGCYRHLFRARRTLERKIAQ